MDTLPAAKNQVKSANICIINKIDRVTTDKLEKVTAQVRNLNQEAQIITAEYGRVNFNELLALNTIGQQIDSDLKKSPPEAIYTVSLTAPGTLSYNCIKKFLEKQTERLFRAKGFLNFETGLSYVEWTGDEWKYNKITGREAKNELVLIGRKLEQEKLQQQFEDCKTDN